MVRRTTYRDHFFVTKRDAFRILCNYFKLNIYFKIKLINNFPTKVFLDNYIHYLISLLKKKKGLHDL